MSLPVALTPGTVIGEHYIIGDLINSGGFGAVYRGVDRSEKNRSCAIKETYDVTPTARRQALMEAGVLFTVRSKHLPEVYDALEANGRFYLVMQLIEGQNLFQLLRTRVPGGDVGTQEAQRSPTGPCSEQEVLNWLLPIMDVLQELHSRNPPVLHRDIKPGNIILTPQHTAVLVDFGLTKLYNPGGGTQTMIKAVSEGFSPLEQYIGKTSPQSDIYSLAATMYLLLTNRLPPPSVSRSMHDNLLPPRQLNPSLSLKMERVLLKALSINADQRYASMREFMQALNGPSANFHADETHYSGSAQSMPFAATTQASTPPPPPPYQQQQRSDPYQQPPSGPRPGYPSGPYQQPSGPHSGYPGVPPQQQPSSGPQSGYSAPPPSYPHLPPGYVMVPRSALQPVQALPSPFGQGCLWGLLQGIFVGILIVVTKKEADFYLAIMIGMLFYVMAGLRTTRKGGSSTRGGWAGYWTAILGILVFGVTLGIGVSITYTQSQQEISVAHPFLAPTRIAEIAWNTVQPHWPNVMVIPKQNVWVNLLALALIGLVIAWLLGWFGGLIGKALHAMTTPANKNKGFYP